MTSRPRHSLAQPALFAALAALLCFFAWLRPAFAWIDLAIKSDVATVEVAADGRATVHHEMVVRLRGGPLKRLTVEPVDADATPLPGATIVRAKSGVAAGVPIALLVERDETLLTLNLAYTKGVPSGSYIVEFSYETNLLATSTLQRTNQGSLLSWKSPRFSDGIGSLKTRFVFPRSDTPPRLWTGGDPEEGSADSNLVATQHGVFLTELIREDTRDVLELTRPHAAKGEQVTWPIAFGDQSTSPVAAGATPPEARPKAKQASRGSEQRPLPWLLGTFAGLGFALLVWAKHRFLSTQRGEGETSAQFLVPLPTSVRLVAIGLAVMVAVVVCLQNHWATAAASSLLIATVLSVQHATVQRVRPRGPGVWQASKDGDEPVDPRELRGFGVLLEGTTIPGFFVFALGFGGVLIAALRPIRSAPFHSATLLAFGSLLVPLFFTLGGALLTLPRLELERRAILPLYRLMRRRRLPVEMIERIAHQRDSDAPVKDEWRLRFIVPYAVPGFDSLELAVEVQHGGWFAVRKPVFIARVRDASEAHQALPRDAEWSRGRHRDERVALLRPAHGSDAACARMARQIIQRLQGGKTASPRANQARKSRGNSEFTSKGAALAPPA